MTGAASTRWRHNMAEKPLGIFCVEGDWSPSLVERASVRDLLQILEDVAGIPYIHPGLFR